MTDGIIQTESDFSSKTYTTTGIYDGKRVKLIDKKNITYFNNPQYIYKINDIVEFTFTNPTSNEDSKVYLKITKIDVDFSNLSINYIFNAILAPPPTSENYQNSMESESIGIL